VDFKPKKNKKTLLEIRFFSCLSVPSFLSFSDVILSKMRVKSRDGHVRVGFGYSKGESRSVFVHAARIRICSFLLVSRPLTDTPNLDRQTRSGSEQMSEPDMRLTNLDPRLDARTSCNSNPSGFQGFRGVQTNRKPRKPGNQTGHSNREELQP